jgi:hypothetical protein
MGIFSFGIGEAVGGIAQGAGNAALGAGIGVLGAGVGTLGTTLSAGAALFKLGDLLHRPVDMLCNYLEQPLEMVKNNREEQSKDKDLQRHIARETEIVRIITEIEQLKKDKEFERMKAVSDAMMNYQTELTRINIEAVEAIGSMRIELQRKAYELIHEKSQQYNDLQDRALLQAQDQLERIDSNQNMSEASKNIMINAVDKKLAGIIDNATRFLELLNDDMQLISKDINLITSSGQDFIQRHLEQFQLIGLSGDTTALLENSNERLVSFEK